jgi:signal transduction histidine kinase
MLSRNDKRFMVQRPKMAEETLENAFAATLSPCKSEVKEYSDLPVYHLFLTTKPIRVTIGSSDTDVMFRVSDQGGGIAKDIIDRVWSFFHLTERNLLQADKKRFDRMRMGLAMSRAYADYWGGSLTLARY